MLKLSFCGAVSDHLRVADIMKRQIKGTVDPHAIASDKIKQAKLELQKERNKLQ